MNAKGVCFLVHHRSSPRHLDCDLRLFHHRETNPSRLNPTHIENTLAKVIAVNIGKLHRRAVLKVLEPRRVIPIVVAAAALIALGDQNLLRSGNIVAQIILPAASVGNRRRVASRQLVTHIDAEVKNLAPDSHADAAVPGLASLEACGGFGGALGCRGAEEFARGALGGVVADLLRHDHVVGPALDAAGVVVHRVGGDVGAFVAGVGAAAVGVVLAVFSLG
jgi:hypothetical protein